jgi:DNA repair protein SbcD/Mre11
VLRTPPVFFMLHLFHTADWHLGQKFHEYDREEEHQQFLHWLLQQLTEKQPDVLLLAGDVYDSIHPPASSVRMFHHFLAEARRCVPGLQMVITAGNHDSAARLEAPHELYAALGIHVVGTVQRMEGGGIDFERFIIPLRDKSGAVVAAALAIPFLRSADVPLVPDVADPYMAGIKALYQQATQAALAKPELQAKPLLALGHCHMQSGQESTNSERRIVIGGVEALAADAFPPELCYIALGHLHRPQHIQHQRIVYSGSPLPLSFTERDYPHQVVELHLDNAGQVQTQPLRIPVMKALLRLPEAGHAAVEDVLRCLSTLPPLDEAKPSSAPYLEVRVLLDSPRPALRAEIERELKGKHVQLARIDVQKPEATAASTEASAYSGVTLQNLSSIDPFVLFRAAHQEEYEKPPSAELEAAFKDVLTAMQQKEAHA